MKKSILLALVIILAGQIHSQSHLYYKLDVGTNHIYSFAISNLATGWLNALTDRMLFDNAYSYTYINDIDNKGYDSKQYSITGITARELFSDVTIGAKIGYQSASPSVFNWGLFGSAHYRVNQFKTLSNTSDAILHNDLQRLLLGGGALLSFGNIESSTRLTFEAALRYEMPLGYKGYYGKDTNFLNNGLSSHFALRVNGSGALQGLGIYADIPHYKLFKDNSTGNLKMYTFGIIYTITPWKIKGEYGL